MCVLVNCGGAFLIDVGVFGCRFVLRIYFDVGFVVVLLVNLGGLKYVRSHEEYDWEWSMFEGAESEVLVGGGGIYRVLI